jgi:hypothetical protein
MDPRKVQTIVDWATLAFVQDVQCFLGFANFYQCFITHYSLIMAPFTWLTRKDQPFLWGVEAKNVFQSLKVYFTTAPLLIHVNPSKPFVLDIDISNFTIGALLSQLGEDNLLHHVDFRFCKFSSMKINYKIHD